MSMDDIFANFGEQLQSKEPDWRTPNAFYRLEAAQFCRPAADKVAGEASSQKLPEDWPGMDVDPALAVQLLKLEFEGNFHTYGRWLRPDRQLLVAPALTCPGMVEAATALAAAADGGETIAVYCDFDVDGTAAGEVLRLGLAPYGARLHYGYADAQQGFGLTDDFVHEAAAAGASILITLDCGTGQVSQVKLAQSLGMKVIVVDHHNLAANPADFHLNPKLGWDANTPLEQALTTSDNTGAQLAWKLAAATQAVKEGRTRAEHFERALNLASWGCMADMGSVLIHENRAFFWCANTHSPVGVRALAAALGEDTARPGTAITTQAALNLPKRTSKVSAADVGALLAASTEAEAAPYVAKLLEAYEAAKPYRKQMTAAALAQTGSIIRHADGRSERPVQSKGVWSAAASASGEEEVDFIAVAVLGPEFEDYAGYSGPVAQNISRAAGKPAVVFVPRGVDEYGQRLYKFSSRNDAKVNLKLGLVHDADGRIVDGLIVDEKMRVACTLKKRDESGAVVEEPVVGGHAAVVSGSCTEENLPLVVAAMQAYAQRRYKATRSFWPTPWDGPEATLAERKIEGARLAALEEQASWLGPFTMQKQSLYSSARGALAKREASNSELIVSVEGRLGALTPVSEDDKWLQGVLDLGAGVTRGVRFPADIDQPEAGHVCEFVLRVGKPGPYYLRVFNDATPDSD
jgi:single-stranded DNA-specific DHH superfamily exonuclease